MSQPNILLIMTDEERYAPHTRLTACAPSRNSQLTARESIRSRALEFHRHYAGLRRAYPAEPRCSPANTHHCTE